MEPGIDILNTGAGHMEVRFTEGDPIELERAGRIISDMLRRGYVLFIEDDDGKLTRVQSFDPKKNVYIIADGPLYSGDGGTASGLSQEPTPQPTPPAPAKRRGRPRKTEVPMATTRVTAIGRSAGG